MSVAEADPEWAVGFEDECWWSRLALPTLSSWVEEGKPLRLIQQSVAKDDLKVRRPSPATGSLCARVQRDVVEVCGWSARERYITTQFLRWCTDKLEAVDKKVLLLIWDNASWHISKEVRRW